MHSKKLLPLGILLLMVSGCAIHSGNFNSGVAITNNQFKVLGTATGKASTLHILGIGGLATDALVADAKRDLYSRYPLTNGMLLANISVDFKRSFYLVASVTEVTLSGDIIDFNPSHFEMPYQGFYTEDSTFFPTEKIGLPLSVKSQSDKNQLKIVPGNSVSFLLNGVQTKATVKEINSYGLKCEYQTAAGTRKIYLRPDQVTLEN